MKQAKPLVYRVFLGNTKMNRVASLATFARWDSTNLSSAAPTVQNVKQVYRSLKQAKPLVYRVFLGNTKMNRVASLATFARWDSTNLSSAAPTVQNVKQVYRSLIQAKPFVYRVFLENSAVL